MPGRASNCCGVAVFRLRASKRIASTFISAVIVLYEIQSLLSRVVNRPSSCSSSTRREDFLEQWAWRNPIAIRSSPETSGAGASVFRRPLPSASRSKVVGRQIAVTRRSRKCERVPGGPRIAVAEEIASSRGRVKIAAYGIAGGSSQAIQRAALSAPDILRSSAIGGRFPERPHAGERRKQSPRRPRVESASRQRSRCLFQDTAGSISGSIPDSCSRRKPVAACPSVRMRPSSSRIRSALTRLISGAILQTAAQVSGSIE